MQDFHNLRVWTHAVALALNTRRVVSRFPPRGYSRIKAQMIDAAESIVDTIVEGCGAATQLELARFLDLAIKSATELEGQYLMARYYQIIEPREYAARSTDTIDARKMLFGLREEVLASPDRDPSRSISHAKSRCAKRTTRDARDSTPRKRTGRPKGRPAEPPDAETD
jgi:four helix bundle protein